MKLQELLSTKKQTYIPETFQEWTTINRVDECTITLNNNKRLIILRVFPINFKLKSSLEQKAILMQYQMFLKNLNSQIQIVVSSKKTDISNHIDEVFKSTNENSKIHEMSEDYILFLKQVVAEKGTITKEFYIVIEDGPNSANEVLKIKEYLQNCGNVVEDCSKEEVLDLIKCYVNKRVINLI